MYKFTSYVATAAVIAAMIALPLAAFAQTATMPVLYNSAGVAVNQGNTTPLIAGYYFLAPGDQASTEVYYYGNGTYYDQTTGLYGGSVSDPNGTAGVALNYSASVTAVPSVPNTGVGGNAAIVWAILIVSGAIVCVGAAYLLADRYASENSLKVG